MNYITVNHEPKYIIRRLIAFILIGTPLALGFLKVLSFVILFCHEIGIY